jgi:hypothetical protein
MLWLTNSTVRPARHALHPPEALALEGHVADGEDLVDEQHLGLEVRGDGEREAEVHAGRVVLHRRVGELRHLGEGEDLVELARDVGALHAEDRAAQEDVLAAGELAVEPGADLEQRADAPAHLGEPLRGPRDAREDLQQRALARAVAADHAEHFARRDLERHVAQGPERVRVRRGPPAERPPRGAHDRLAQRLVGRAAPEPVALAEARHAERHVR